jgi:hypothetical protein
LSHQKTKKEVIKMTAQEALKRNEKSQWLKVWQVDDTCPSLLSLFYVESEDGKIAYKCCISDQGDFCNCGDFVSRSKNDPQFKCKHLLAVMNSIPKDEVLEAHFLEKRKPKLDERFIKTIDGKDFVLYAGLLDLSHQKNLISIDVELLQYPSKENDHTAVCKAIAKTATGGIFVDLGDANFQNCNAKVAKHIIRLSSTRAKARCLRDLTNIGMTCLEELGDFNEVIGEDETGKFIRKDNIKKFPAKQVKAAQPGNGDGRKSKHENPIPSHENGQMVVQPDTSVLSPAEAPANKEAAERTDSKPGKVSKVPVTDNANVPAETKPQTEKKTKAAKSDNGNGKSKEKAVPVMSEAQKNALYNLSRRRGISVEELENLSMKTFNMPLENLTSADASTFIRTLQQSA